MDSPFVSVAEAAALLGVSTATLRNWDKQGKLTARRHPINKYRMYAREEIDALASQTSLFAPEPLSVVDSTAPDARSSRRLIARMHNILRDNDSQSNIVLRFDEITKLIFLKVMSDRAAPATASSISRGSSVVQSIRDQYAQLAAQHSKLIPATFSSLLCSDAAVRQCVEALEMVNFSNASFDVKGMAYEEVIRNTFDKSDHQQFFTPPQVTEFIVSACEPFLEGEICDPACGTGGFLASVARRNLPYTTLTGMEIDERLAWVAGVNMLLHGAHDINTLLLPEGGTLGRSAEKYFGHYNAILTNPPFGSDLAEPDLLNRMKLGVGRPSRRRGILFIERCCNLLKPGGVLGIIIDEGVLNLPHAQDVREFILKSFDMDAVISLPETTFQPYATVNASVLLLRKRPSKGPVQ
jgi:type I restriction enzyme M protein